MHHVGETLDFGRCDVRFGGQRAFGRRGHHEVRLDAGLGAQYLKEPDGVGDAAGARHPYDHSAHHIELPFVFPASG